MLGDSGHSLAVAALIAVLSFYIEVTPQPKAHLPT